MYIGTSVKAEEEEFARVLESRAKAGDGKLKVVDIYKKESEIEAKEILTLSKVVEGVKAAFPGFVHHRIPVKRSHLYYRLLQKWLYLKHLESSLFVPVLTLLLDVTYKIYIF